MPVEMIGWIAPRVSSELIPPSGPPFDAEVIAETARIHERAGFDRVLIGYFSGAPDGFLVGAHAAAVTERLSFLLAHRPGFVAPPVAARKLATLDQLSDGRLAVHIISGGSDADQAKDGDWTDPETRYRRSAEYISLLRRTWTEPAPFDHAGEFYRTRGTYSQIRCRQQPHIPIYGGGGSDAAIRALALHVDVYMLWGEPLKETALFMDRVRRAAALSGRNPTFSLSTRPILVQQKEQLGTEPGLFSTGCWSIVAARRYHSARILVPNGSCRLQRKPKCTTPVCGHRSPSRRALQGIRRPLSARRKQSRRLCSSTTS
jgi:alkanesulfonate monooxygenase